MIMALAAGTIHYILSFQSKSEYNTTEKKGFSTMIILKQLKEDGKYSLHYAVGLVAANVDSCAKPMEGGDSRKTE
jgi:hypothetical protein